MADVGKVQGPSGSPENLGRREKTPADAEKFKQAMRKKVTEVSQVDPDEQKKRKRQEEAEQEAATQGQAPAPTPSNTTSPQAQEDSPFKIQGGKKLGAASPQTSSGQPSSSPPPAAASPPPAGTPSTPAGAPTFSETQTGSQNQPNSNPQKPSSTQQTKGAGNIPPSKQSPAEEKPGLSSAALEGTSVSKTQDSSAFFQQFQQKEEEQKPLSEDEVEALDSAGVIPPAPPFAQQTEKKEEELPFEAAAAMGDLQQAPIQPPSPPSGSLPPYAYFSPQVMEIFDRMVGVMTVMATAGLTETTFTLNAPQFASSVFFGAQIIIQEFSTAPKAFNIQFKGQPSAVTLFQGQVEDLIAAFQAGNYNFRVNRLETGYLTERPLFKRKEKTGEKNPDDRGEKR